MSAIVDFHGHIYPQYDPDRLFTALVSNAQRRFPGTKGSPVLCLAERSGQQWFAETFGKGANTLKGGLKVTPCEDGLSIRFQKGEQQIFVITGRQIVSEERLEVLSLTSDVAMEDGLSIRTVIDRILAVEGIPVLPWSPGKWMGERGRIVRQMFDHYGSSKLFVGDTSMRPAHYSGGEVFRWASEAGYIRLPGSDPLPLKGEEKRAGNFSIRVAIPCEQPGLEIRDFLRSPSKLDFPPSQIGYLSVFSRLLRLKLKK